MSRSVHKERVEAQNRNPKKLPAETSKITEQINNTIKDLCDRTIPSQPYLLSVPSDVPYRHCSRFINTWYIDTPFTAQEEQLQYVSFFSHQGEEESLLRVVGEWADERGNLIEEEATSPASLSGRNTPIEQPNRKKISLQDYKTKDKTRPNTPVTKAPTVGLRKEVMKSEAKEHAGRTEEVRKPAKVVENVVGKGKHENVKVEKRPLDGAQSPRPTDSRRQDLPSPRKRRRLSSESPKRQAAPIKVEKSREVEESKDLPLLLSPTLPAQQRQRDSKALPELLVPKLPPALEKLVAKADNKSKPEPNTGTRTDPVRTILGNALGSMAGKRPPEKTPSDSNANRVRSDSQNSVKAPVGTPKVLSPAVRPALKTITRPVTPLQNGVSASPKPRQRHIIALRYGKKNRKRVEALLKFASRPKKMKSTIEEVTRPESRPSSTKPAVEVDRVEKAEKAEKVEKVEKKRPADPSPERPVKKVKQLDTPEKPRLVGASAIKSPAVTGTIVKPKAEPKTEPATPKKELKSSITMRRIESQDGGDVRTPQADRGRTSTPVNTTSSAQAKASPGPSNLISKEDRAAWQEINSKCFALGRTLKHEGTSLGPSPGKERTDKDQALSVVLLIEALLCFMINHAAQSQARPSVDPGWSTVLPYHIFVFRASRKYRHLHGLVIQLGAICRQAIHNHDIEKLAREPLPFENWDSAPTPGSDGTTKQSEDVEKMKKKYISFRDQLVLNARELQSAWLEGSRYLSPVLIEREYPKTWAKRTKDTAKRGVDKLKPDSIGREYYLPLDINSNAFEAARFSLSFLREWSDKEKIDWKPRIEF